MVREIKIVYANDSSKGLASYWESLLEGVAQDTNALKRQKR